MVEEFKNTDAGIIPIDWQTQNLSKISDFENGKAHEQFIDDKGDYIVVNSKFISTEGVVKKFSKKNLSPLLKGNIAIVMSDIPNGKALAKCFLIERDNRYTLNQRIGCIKPYDDIDNDYLFYKLNRNKYFLSFDSGSGQTNLKKNEILDCPIALPPTKAEQTAIATALNDADALITQLEELIAKKRVIKQGAMQELLKPKEGWEAKKLGKICSRITTGKLDANAMKVDGEYRFYTCAKDFYFIDKYAFDDEALLISGNGENVGYVHYYKGKFNAYQRTYVLTGFNQGIQYLKKYLDEYLAARIEVEVNAGNTPYIRMRTLTEMDIYFPKDESEQTRIAQIVSDMDAEIEALENKLNKYKMIKQGMMQNLLTGRIRLV